MKTNFAIRLAGLPGFSTVSVSLAQPAGFRQPGYPEGTRSHRDLVDVTLGHERQKPDLPRDGVILPLVRASAQLDPVGFSKMTLCA